MKPTKEISFWKPIKISSVVKKPLTDFSRIKTPPVKNVLFRDKKVNSMNIISNPKPVHPININTKNVPKKQMNWIQAKTKYPKLNPFGDIDRDGVINMLDCKPFNKQMQEPKGESPFKRYQRKKQERKEREKSLLEAQQAKDQYTPEERKKILTEFYTEAEPYLAEEKRRKVKKITPDKLAKGDEFESKKSRVKTAEDIFKEKEPQGTETETKEAGQATATVQKVKTKEDVKRIMELKKKKRQIKKQEVEDAMDELVGKRNIKRLLIAGKPFVELKVGGKKYRVSTDYLDPKTGLIQPKALQAMMDKALEISAGKKIQEQTEKTEKQLKEFEKLMKEAKQPKKIFRTFYTPTQAKGLAEKKVLQTQLGYMEQQSKALKKDIKQLTALVKTKMKEKEERIELPATALKRLSRIKRDIEKLPSLKPEKVETLEPLTTYSVSRKMREERKKPEDYFRVMKMKPEDYRVEPYGSPSAQTLVDTAFTGREKIPKKTITPYEQMKTLENVGAIIKKEEDKKRLREEREARRKVQVIPGATLLYSPKEEPKREKVFKTATETAEQRERVLAQVADRMKEKEEKKERGGAIEMIKQKLFRKEIEPLEARERRLKEQDLNIRQTIKNTEAELRKLKREELKDNMEKISKERRREEYREKENKREAGGEMIDLTRETAEQVKARRKEERKMRKEMREGSMKKPKLPDYSFSTKQERAAEKQAAREAKQAARQERLSMKQEAKEAKADEKEEAKAYELQKMIEEA